MTLLCVTWCEYVSHDITEIYTVDVPVPIWLETYIIESVVYMKSFTTACHGDCEYIGFNYKSLY